MEEVYSRIDIKIEDCLYQKDPLSSKLGKNIIAQGIELINAIGFELFTFRKLAVRIGSSEASIYRYFESKHKFLLYLCNWYWSWMEYRLAFATTNIPSAKERLQRCIFLLTKDVTQDNGIEHIDERRLHQVVLSESSKTYLVKEVDQENEEGVYHSYKRLIKRVRDIILEIQPDYKYPDMLITTVIEGAHLQRHFAQHLPNLTNSIEGEDAVSNFYSEMVFNALQTQES